MASHRQHWLSSEAESDLEFAETLLAMISLNALYDPECRPYMLVKLCVPAACCVDVTFSALSSTYMQAAPALRTSEHLVV